MDSPQDAAPATSGREGEGGYPTQPILTRKNTPGSVNHCAYCDTPLPAGHKASAYCCYGCRILGEAGRKPLSTEASKVSPWFKIAVGAVLAGQSMLLDLVVNLTPPEGHARWMLHAALMVSSVAAALILGRPLLQSAFEDLRQKRISIEILFIAGIAGAFGASVFSTLSGRGAIYYEVVAVLLTVYSFGKTLGARSRAQALAETRHLQTTFDCCQKINPDGSTATLRVAEISIGDQVRVLPGEPIPIDGLIVQGRAFVCETPLTGEPYPVVRREGDAVLAGSYCEDAELRIVATVAGAARQLDALLGALASARERPSRIQARADAVVRWFLPLVFSTSLLTFLFWTWRSGWSVGLFNSLAVLLIACPCAMGLATPVAVWSALAALAARGFVVRSGDVIERLANLDTVVFDKTGTLSDESFSLIDLATVGGAQERQEILFQLAAVQQAGSHPVARAFRPTGLSSADSAFRVRSLKPVPALGVEAWIESDQPAEHHLRIGQRGLITDPAPEQRLLESLTRTSGDHLVYVEVDGRLSAIAAVRERLRDSAGAAIRALEQKNVRCLIMTGDQSERAQQLLRTVGQVSDLPVTASSEGQFPTTTRSQRLREPAGQRPAPQGIGLSSIEGGLTPQEKAMRIEALENEGRQVGFVGDGVNDALAMRKSSLGIALAHGAGVTTAGADAVLYGGDLRLVPWAVALSRQVTQSLRMNLLFAAVYNIIGMILAATGLLHPVVSALLMVVSSFSVAWRALRSAECSEDCCAIADPGELRNPTRLITEAPKNKTSTPWPQMANGILVIAQIPFLILAGQLSLAASLIAGLGLLGLGMYILRFRSENAEWSRMAQMGFAMLGIGNWGMILGWWVDAGFAPLGVHCINCMAHGSPISHIALMPWMNAGMLLFGLPPMILSADRLNPGWPRLGIGLIGGVGMILGMSYGNYVFMKWFGPWTSDPTLVSFAGMTAGMLLGMFAGCETGRALFALRTKQQLN